MLVLGRKIGERIRLNENITITVVSVAGDRVRIGLEAPDDVVIRRDELQPRKDGLDEQAA